MPDIFSKEKRSQIMSSVRAIETQPEIKVRKFLFSRGFRYRKNVKHLPGKPDIVLPKYNTVIFIHGCFWHGHKNCNAAALPKSRQEYWYPKINDNRERDKKRERELKKLGWQVINLWECEIKDFLISGSKKQLNFLTSIIKQISL